MKPNFALDLSHEGVSLLHRVAGGWHQIGAVNLDDEAIDEHIADLRRKATAMETRGLTTKLVIPNSQILYRTVALDASERKDPGKAIAKALEGATPYALDELVWDTRDTANGIEIAVVARETLQEAEAFAREHRFNPLCFVARPAEGAFQGEPQFGRTSCADDLVGPDTTVECDDVPVTEIGIEPQPAPKAVVETKPAPVDLLVDEIGTATPPPSNGAKVTAEGIEEGREIQTAPPPERPHVAVTAGELPTDPVQEAPKLKGPSKPRAAGPLPEAAAMPAPTINVAREMPAATAPAPVRPPAPTSSISSESDLVPLSEADAGLGSTMAAPPGDGLATFGTISSSSGGVGRGVMLAIAALILALLAGIGVWLMTGGDTDGAALMDAVPPAGESDAGPLRADAGGNILIPTDADDESAEDIADADMGLQGAIEVAEATQAEVPADEADPLDADDMAAAYAATGIWAQVPSVANPAEGSGIDDLYITSIDPVTHSQDAMGLMPPTALSEGDAPRPIRAPLPPGLTFDLDENGLVRATPDGAISPEGVVVYAGRPAVVTALRPGTATEADETDSGEEVASEVEAVPEDAELLALAGFQPRQRPEALIENSEKANLGGLTRAQLGAFAPRTRPASAQEEALAAREDAPEGTAPVVGASLMPKVRPPNFSKLAQAAAAAAAAASTAADNDTTTNSSAQRVTARVPENKTPPAGPVSVARAATVKNAINLRDINLMGVFGSSKDRRALVRLKNGRFTKVQVGDRLDGGRVHSIAGSSLVYVKGNRSITLEVGE